MRKLLLLASVLFLAVIVHGQGKSISVTYNMSTGDTEMTSVNLVSYSYISIQITAIGLDASDATFTLYKTNDFTNYGYVPSGTGIFTSGNSTRFIEFANNFGNSGLRLSIKVNSVTEGTLKININFIRK